MMNKKDTNPKDAIGCKKPPLSTLSMPVLFEAGAAMLEGACKYGRHNYREIGVRASIYYDATMRHMADWWEGQDIDEKSGLHHLTKAIASLMVLRDAQMRDMVNDDRPPKFDNDLDRMPWMEQMQTRIDIVLGKYPDPLPPYTQKKIDGETKFNVPPGIKVGRDMLMPFTTDIKVGIEDETEDALGPRTMSVGLLNVGDVFSTEDGTFKVIELVPEANMIKATCRRIDGSYEDDAFCWSLPMECRVSFKGTGKES